jgi:hypothetical protein
VKTKREIDSAVKKMQGVIKGVLYHSVKTVDEKSVISTVLKVKVHGVPIRETKQLELIFLLRTNHTILILFFLNFLFRYSIDLGLLTQK